MAPGAQGSASSGYSSLSETLHAVTSIKLSELNRQKNRLNDHFAPVLERLPLKSSEKERLKSLYDALKEGKKRNIELNNTDVTVDQVESIVGAANEDPSTGGEVYKSHTTTLVESVMQAQRKYEYAYLFGSIFNEWLKTDGKMDMNASEAAAPRSGATDDGDGDETMGGYEDTGRPELQKQKQFLEETIFAKRESADADSLIRFVQQLFPINEKTDRYGNKYPQHGSIGWVRKELKAFGDTLRMVTQISVKDVRQSVENILSGDTLTDSKRAACKELLLSEVILSEIAAVLTMTLRSIETWAWPSEGVNMNFRRQLNGKYRCYLDSGLVDAIFLQHVGVQWGIKLRQVLGAVLKSNSWLRPKDPLDKRHREIRDLMFAGESRAGTTMRAARQAEFRDQMFMTMLPENMYDFRSYKEDGDEESDYDVRSGRRPGQRLRATEVKQRLLQRILCDVQMAQVINPESVMTAVHVDLEQYGPSLSHEVILALCEFAGVGDEWVTFFKSFLSVPSKMSETEEPRMRKCGVPINHSISAMLSEYILFFLEAAVNRKTEGKLELVRLHDDFWFWSPDEQLCQTGWQVMREFADLSGLNWNLEKSGSIKIKSGAGEGLVPASEPLPQNAVKWGFVSLHQDGIFRIGRDMVSEHVTEMIRQLRAQRSILGWIKSYNRYMKFFIDNFAQPARSFGLQHVEQIISEINYIHRNLFPDCEGSVFEQVRRLIRERFPDVKHQRILDSWILLPLALGGLGVKNMTMELHALKLAYEDEHKRAGVAEMRSFADCVEADKKAYEDALQAWNDRFTYPSMEHLLPEDEFKWITTKDGLKTHKKHRPNFMSYDEYVLGRETCSQWWHEVWEALAQIPQPMHPVDPDRVIRALGADSSEIKPLRRDWKGNAVYWKWMLSLYGPQLLDEFGRLDFMDRKLIPLGMIDSFNTKKIKWDQ